MSWDIDCESWELFPVAQKWFATGEALAHLRYLEGEGRIRRTGGQKVFTFSMPPGTETGEPRRGCAVYPAGTPERRLLRLGCRSR